MRSYKNHAVAACCAIALLLTAVSAADDGRIVVRVPAESANDLDRLSVTTRLDLDYGSYRWLELDRESLAALEASGLKYSTVEDAGTIQVQGFRFDPLLDGEPEIPDNLRGNPDRAGFRFVQLVGPPTDAWLARLEEEGLKPLQYYPSNTYLVWAQPGKAEAAAALPFVRWQGLFHSAYAINSELEGRTGIVRNVDVMFYNDGDLQTTLDDLAKLGGVVLNHYPSQPDRAFFNAIVELKADAVEDVARFDTVLWIGYQSPEPGLDDEKSDQIVAGVDPLAPGYDPATDLGYDGAGVIWAVIDSGIDYDHPDLGPSIVGGYSFPNTCAGPPGTDCSNGGHGTHVAGIVGGSGVGDAGGPYTDGDGFLYGLGVAPGAGLFAMNSISASPQVWPPAGGWQEHSKRAVLGGAVGGNNSWWTTESPTPHGYQASERTHDIMVRDGNFDTASVAEPFIEVFSAGNSGFSGLTAPKEAKNLIVTAASENERFGGDQDEIASFSSRGPAVDGRFVPTIAAPGDDIASSRNDLGGLCSSSISGTNSLYAYCSGTSMAAPHVSGLIAVAMEWWRDISEGVVTDLSPAMAKALVVNSAVDMGVADIWNINEGWGRINITNLIDPGVWRVLKDQEELFTDTGQEWQMTVGIDDPAKPLKVTIAWSDAPGAVGANPALVNNLDLEVDADGTTYLGNDFDAGWSTTGGAADTINNLENVYLETAPSAAMITVTATAIAGDGVPYNGDTTDQDFVIVCQNCVEEPTFVLGVDPSSLEVCAPADGQYAIDVEAILGFSDPVTLAVTGVPAGATSSFSTNPVNPTGSSTLTISDTGSAAVGSYELDITGTSGPTQRLRAVGLNLFDAVPGAVALSAPADGATNQPARPTFEWAAPAQGGSYRIQVDINESFSSPVVDEDGIAGTSFTPSVDLQTNTIYYWRVMSTNGCGEGDWSTTWDFITESLPGDCGLGTSPVEHMVENFEADDGGFTHSGTQDTWTRSTNNSHSGDWSFYGEDVGTVSDQRLVTPEITLPSSGSPITLQFWNWQEIEESTSGCWDGAIVEITTNDGADWTQIENEKLLTDPYDGPIETNASNPLSGLDAWCGDPQDWLKSVVDIDAYAGETVRFRFRLGTDVFVSREGWYIDDVVVQSCGSEVGIFSDGFESGDLSAWSRFVP